MARPIPTPTVVYEVVPDAFDVDAGVSPLAALTARLDHLAALSVDGLALSPLVRAADPLRIHPTDSHAVDPALGTEAELTTLIASARARGIGTYLMGVFDHVSSQHPWFIHAKSHTSDEEDTFPPEQRTRAFFTFDEDLPHGYACRDGDPTLPELDLKNPDVRRRLFTGEESVLHQWLRWGVAGVRILRADAVGYSILRDCRRGTLTMGGDHVLIGDILGFSDRYVKDGLLDAVVNHYLREAIIGFFRGQLPARQLARVMRDLSRCYGSALLRSWNILSGHNFARVSHVLVEQKRTRLATMLSYLLPGAAHVFSGDEVGVDGRAPPDHLPPIRWESSRWNTEMFNLHVTLGNLRRTLPALNEGEFVDLTPEGEEEIFAFARVTRDPRETVIVAVNRASQTRVRKLFAPVCDLPDGLRLKDVLEGDGATVRVGTVNLEIRGQDARVLVPDDGDVRGSRFFRGY